MDAVKHICGKSSSVAFLVCFWREQIWYILICLKVDKRKWRLSYVSHQLFMILTSHDLSEMKIVVLWKLSIHLSMISIFKAILYIDLKRKPRQLIWYFLLQGGVKCGVPVLLSPLFVSHFNHPKNLHKLALPPGLQLTFYLWCS